MTELSVQSLSDAMDAIAGLRSDDTISPTKVLVSQEAIDVFEEMYPSINQQAINVIFESWIESNK